MGWEFESMQTIVEEQQSRWSEGLYRSLTVMAFIAVIFLSLGGFFGA